MVFSSLIFLYIFLPLNLLLYFISNNLRYRNFVLIIFSLFFYAWGEPFWILLLLFTATIDYLNALFIDRFIDTKWAKIGVVSSIVLNIGVLMIFKYSGFIYRNLNYMFNLGLEEPGFSLPIGISFYTFQTLSYVIDVYKKEVKAQKSPEKFLLFISLYPQLVAGPIVRYVYVDKEIEKRESTIMNVSAGITRFCIGLFKKVFIANVAGEYVVKYMNADWSDLSIAGAWFGALMFTIQIYFDFSGYSDMAIGLGRIFGFQYPENFKYPYISKSATEFWRRWHISLGSFFRDYVYIPLGGNRRHQYFNLFVVWFLTGLWHGASWNFIIWGLYFGVLIAIERIFLSKLFTKLPSVFSHIYLIFAVIIGWVFFYFEDAAKMFEYLRVMFALTDQPLTDFELEFVLRENIFWIIFSMILCLPVYLLIDSWIVRQLVPTKKLIPLMMIAILFNSSILFISTSMLVGKSYNPFIYFRF